MASSSGSIADSSFRDSLFTALKDYISQPNEKCLSFQDGSWKVISLIRKEGFFEKLFDRSTVVKDINGAQFHFEKKSTEHITELFIENVKEFFDNIEDWAVKIDLKPPIIIEFDPEDSAMKSTAASRCADAQKRAALRAIGKLRTHLTPEDINVLTTAKPYNPEQAFAAAERDFKLKDDEFSEHNKKTLLTLLAKYVQREDLTRLTDRFIVEGDLIDSGMLNHLNILAQALSPSKRNAQQIKTLIELLGYVKSQDINAIKTRVAQADVSHDIRGAALIESSRSKQPEAVDFILRYGPKITHAKIALEEAEKQGASVIIGILTPPIQAFEQRAQE
jgi:hypothetical protein